MNNKTAAALLALLTLGFAVSHAQTPEPASLQALLKRIDALEAELRTLKSPKPATVTAAGKEDKLAIGGYVQANTEFGEAPDTRFPSGDRVLLRRARLGVKGTFAEHFDFTFQSDFGNNSIGGVSGYRAQITDCFATWNQFPAAQVTIGQFKTPYGFEQLLPDTKTLTVERSLSNDQLTLSRQIGVMLGGTALGNRLTYSAAMFNGNGVNNGANDNDQFLYVGRVTGTLAESKQGRLAVGANAFTTRDTGTFTGRRVGTGFDAQATWGAVELQAEYFRTHFDRDTGTDTNANGWSVLGAVMLVPKTWQAIVRYERYDPNRSVANDHSDVWTAGFNYFIKGDDLKLSANYLLGDPAGPLAHQGRLLTRLQIIF